MKKIINHVDEVVSDSLHGLADAHPDLIRVHYDPTYVVWSGSPCTGKVALVSGGGSGHEPLHSGFVGLGMLDGACPGEIFTSPTPEQIEACTKAVSSGVGVLHIIKNYTGDLLNFEMARELCEAAGLEVSSLVVADDVAVKDSLYTSGRRGVGTTVLVERICGAGAARGMSLAQVKELGERVCEHGRSIGVALSSCTVPAAGRPTFKLADGEIEFGVGIHGEPGREREPHPTACELVGQMAEAVLADLACKRGDQLIVMVNGMGGTPLLELYLAYHELHLILKSLGIKVEARLVGNYITSLEMQGCSLTLLRADQQMLDLWYAPLHTAALRWGV